MTKNIIVVDEQGDEYEATYPKRAKGLVKNGRARFINEKTICLACPPNKNLEDNMNNININETVERENATLYTMDYCLEQIAKIQADNEYLYKAIKEFGTLVSEGANDFGSAEKAKGIADVVRCRETTNQKLLEFYNKMYEDLRPATMQSRMQAAASVKGWFEGISHIGATNLTEDYAYSLLADVTEKISRLADQIINS